MREKDHVCRDRILRKLGKIQFRRLVGSNPVPDRDFSKVQNGLNALLPEIAEADGKLDKREEMAIERIIAVLEQENSTYSSIKRAASLPITGISSAAGWIKGKITTRSDKTE